MNISWTAHYHINAQPPHWEVSTVSVHLICNLKDSTYHSLHGIYACLSWYAWREWDDSRWDPLLPDLQPIIYMPLKVNWHMWRSYSTRITLTKSLGAWSSSQVVPDHRLQAPRTRGNDRDLGLRVSPSTVANLREPPKWLWDSGPLFRVWDLEWELEC